MSFEEHGAWGRVVCFTPTDLGSLDVRLLERGSG
jgi:hypothetical protein